jgi:hypothetical protein
MSPDEEKALNFLIGFAKESVEKGMIATLDPRNGDMPKLWDSAEGGMAFELNNIVIAFQVSPKRLSEAFARIGSSSDAPQSAKYKIHSAMSCYYKKGTNPHCLNEECRCPFLVLSQMEDLSTNKVFIRKYIPGKFQDRNISAVISTEEAFQSFLAELLVDNPGTPIKIDGGLKEASMMVSGKDFTREANETPSSGCLGIFLILVSMPIVLFLSLML